MSRYRTKILYGFTGLSLCAIFAAYVMLGLPLSFAVNKVANHFHHGGTGLPNQLASKLIALGIATDWSVPEAGIRPIIQYPTLRTAASPDNSAPFQTYTDAGQPQRLIAGEFKPPPEARLVAVSSTKQLLAAIDHARAGDIITIAPGDYTIKRRSVTVRSSGEARLPIYVRAEKFGSVMLNLDSLEGFHVLAPFWVFENLRIRGVCGRDSNCEHAFHVVGKGQSFTLRNSEVFNFNAPLKVNLQSIGGRDFYADYGLIEHSSFFNEKRRSTANPVTLLNIDAADGWVVRGNYIADFSKNGGDRTSYGAFMKGNGHSGIFEQNLVICEHRLQADQGIRVGLSFGGGGTGARYCKQRNCNIEHYGGIIRNNIIMNCSRDVGIYLNRSAKTQVRNNLLYNTLGIDVRFKTSEALISNNIISGRIRNRDGGQSKSKENIIARNCVGEARKNCLLSEVYVAPDLADFRLQGLDNPIWQARSEASDTADDFCGQAIATQANPGPLQYISGIDCLRSAQRPQAEAN